MEERDRRRFSRINLQWAVRLDFGGVEYKRFVSNVSLCGLYVEGEFQQLVGDICIISLKQSGLFAEEVVQAVASIARVAEGGMAIEFLSMKLDSFLFLQTTLFLSNNIFELEKDLIVFRDSDIELHS